MKQYFRKVGLVAAAVLLMVLAAPLGSYLGWYDPPNVASAAYNHEEDVEHYFEPNYSYSSGRCGPNVTYQLEDYNYCIATIRYQLENGKYEYRYQSKHFITMTISGSGDMYDYTERTLPFADSVIINEGVTSVGDYAFACTNRYLNSMTLVSLPESLTYIGECAFAGNMLNEIYVSKNVRRIGAHAFGFVKNIKWDASAVEVVSREDNPNLIGVEGHWYPYDLGFVGWGGQGALSETIFEKFRYVNSEYYYPHDGYAEDNMSFFNGCSSVSVYSAYTSSSVCPACEQPLEKVKTTLEIGSNTSDISYAFQKLQWLEAVTIPSNVKKNERRFCQLQLLKQCKLA